MLCWIVVRFSLGSEMKFLARLKPKARNQAMHAHDERRSAATDKNSFKAILCFFQGISSFFYVKYEGTLKYS